MTAEGRPARIALLRLDAVEPVTPGAGEVLFRPGLLRALDRVAAPSITTSDIFSGKRLANKGTVLEAVEPMIAEGKRVRLVPTGTWKQNEAMEDAAADKAANGLIVVANDAEANIFTAKVNAKYNDELMNPDNPLARRIRDQFHKELVERPEVTKAEYFEFGLTPEHSGNANTLRATHYRTNLTGELANWAMIFAEVDSSMERVPTYGEMAADLADSHPHLHLNRQDNITLVGIGDEDNARGGGKYALLGVEQDIPGRLLYVAVAAPSLNHALEMAGIERDVPNPR